MVPVRPTIWVVLAAAVLFLPGPARAQTGDGSGPNITLQDDRVTMNVRDARLADVLQTIADKGGFALDIAGDLDAKVTASFERVPLDRALRRLVGQASYIIELTPPNPKDKNAKRRIAKLSVYARGAPKRVETKSTPRAKPGEGPKPAATRRDSDNRGRPDRPSSRRRSRSPSS